MFYGTNWTRERPTLFHLLPSPSGVSRSTRTRYGDPIPYECVVSLFSTSDLSSLSLSLSPPPFLPLSLKSTHTETKHPTLHLNKSTFLCRPWSITLQEVPTKRWLVRVYKKEKQEEIDKGTDWVSSVFLFHSSRTYLTSNTTEDPSESFLFVSVVTGRRETLPPWEHPIDKILTSTDGRDLYFYVQTDTNS